MPYGLTSASFEIRHLSNSVRLMLLNYDRRTQTVKCTLNRLTVEAGRTAVATHTLSVPKGGFQTLRIDNLKAGFYEVHLRLSSKKMKPSLDIRDGSSKIDAEYYRILISPGRLVRTDV